jgi:hypothetical protein
MIQIPASSSRALLFLAPPVEDAADAPTSVERFLLLRVQAVIKRLKLRLDCLQAGKPGLRHLFGERHSAQGRRQIRLVGAQRRLRRGVGRRRCSLKSLAPLFGAR